MRDAIDGALPPGRDPESVDAAARKLPEAEPMPVGDWGQMKRDMLDELYGGPQETEER